ncbi:S1-C subfamily serine protease [Caldalkalibacillus uzonensis]|uniref:S1-C subfamily serine protease n=1 Tax=Caldalkalibacillus uzonensis TaxID=353224 RepID=A0ABU0CXC5_9BACI|nr:trypsin-like peptidase domain-containing protein [Caldalkalibacillus uzonensis]MDQ0340305.1 S1-C subfamily serine protease [Caldalkalibacillus uzonensis]
MSSRIADLYRKLKHRIVSIEGMKAGPEREDLLLSPYFFFPEREERKVSYGSGMIIHPKGYILTCYHVVAGIRAAKVKWGKRPELYQAKLVWAQQDKDVAVLKINPSKKLPTVTFCKDAHVGERVFAIGNPFGFEHTLTMGILSGKERTVSTANNEYEGMLQTDATLNPGNSGGPLFNTKGQVIGMNAIIIQSHQSMGFAIPTRTFLPLIQKYLPKTISSDSG